MVRMRSYTPEFRRSAVAMVESQGISVRKAAERLGMPFHTLDTWVRESRKSATPTVKVHPNTLAGSEARVRELEAEVRRLTLEKEILKKAAAYFAKEHL